MSDDCRNRSFRVIDFCLIAGMILPLLAGIALKVLFVPPAQGIEISGAAIFFTIPLPLGGLPVTEAQINSILVLISLFFLCRFLTHGLAVRAVTKRQLIAEWIVEQTKGLVHTNMNGYFSAFPPFICAILAISACSSLLTLIGLFPPTCDLNVVAGWAILVFFLITYYKMKCGPISYLKSFTEPVPLLLPLNVISEVATPVSMAFRHYGNVLSGTVISILIATLLQKLSALLLGWLPGVLGQIPFLQIGIPAILSVYFDLFSGGLQAFIFAMLTMLYIDGAFPADAYYEKKEKKKARKTAHADSH